MDHHQYIEANRQAWNEAADIHRAHPQWQRLVEGFATPGFSTLEPVPTRRMKEVDLTGKTVYQLCCNNGREVLSMMALGATRGVGFDQAGEFLAQGRELATVAGLAAEFVETSVYNIPETYNQGADFIYISIGAMVWLPDLPQFFRLAAQLLKPGGHLYIYESHPVIHMYEPGKEGAPPDLRYDYFDHSPQRWADGCDYWSGKTYESKEMFCFQHPLGEVLGSILAAGFSLQAFAEYPEDISNLFKTYQKDLGLRLPASMEILARR